MTDQTFQGFGTPEENWSKLPHAMIAALPTIETVSELKVVLYILRHTWGYHENEKRISLDEFANGRKKRGGERLDGGTGLSIPSIRDGIKRAIEHGFITVETDDSDKARVKKFYSLNQTAKGLQSDCKEVTPRVQETCNRTKKETVETNQERHVASATPAPDNVTGKCKRCKNIGVLIDDGFCGTCISIVDGPVFGATPTPADAEPRTMLDALVELRDNPQPGVVTLLSGSPIDADAIVKKPPPYHCKHCGDLVGVDTGDNPDTRGQYFCIRCGVDYFVNELPIAQDCVRMMAYLEWDDELERLGWCGDCYKPICTTEEMPYRNQTCTCEQERELREAFGDPKPAVEVTPTPHWKEQARQPGAAWGEHSPEFQRQLQRFGENGIMVQSLGAHWQKLTRCPLDWNDKKAVKTWSSGLWACLKAAGGDASIVLDATRAAIEADLDIANPYSVLKMTQSLVGKRGRGPRQSKTPPILDQRGLDSPNPLAVR